MTFAGDEIATSGSFRHRSSIVTSKVNLLRLQAHGDLPAIETGPLAAWDLRGVASIADYYARNRYADEAYSMYERVAVRTASVGVKGSRSWGPHLYSLAGLSLHAGRFRHSVDFGSLPEADAIYAALNHAYVNTTIWTGSLTARIGAGWRQPLGGLLTGSRPLGDRPSGDRPSGDPLSLIGVVEASWLPILTRTIKVETDGQHFSKASSSIHLRAGLEWFPALTVLDQPVVVAPFLARRQFFNKVHPLGGASLNEVSLDLLLSPSSRQQALSGLGIGVSWMQSGDWTGWRIQLKGLFD